jgi:hypothetical protein
LAFIRHDHVDPGRCYRVTNTVFLIAVIFHHHCCHSDNYDDKTNHDRTKLPNRDSAELSHRSNHRPTARQSQ